MSATTDAAALLGVAEFEMKRAIRQVPEVAAYTAAVDRFVAAAASDQSEALHEAQAEVDRQVAWRETVVAELVATVRGACPLTVDKSYEPVGPCQINDDGSDCPMAGIASGCAYKGGVKS